VAQKRNSVYIMDTLDLYLTDLRAGCYDYLACAAQALSLVNRLREDEGQDMLDAIERGRAIATGCLFHFCSDTCIQTHTIDQLPNGALDQSVRLAVAEQRARCGAFECLDCFFLLKGEVAQVERALGASDAASFWDLLLEKTCGGLPCAAPSLHLSDAPMPAPQTSPVLPMPAVDTSCQPLSAGTVDATDATLAATNAKLAVVLPSQDVDSPAPSVNFQPLGNQERIATALIALRDAGIVRRAAVSLVTCRRARQGSGGS
jgi:hypothetical protein